MVEWTPNQLVAFNLRRIRLSRGLTQEEAGDRAARLLPGGRWSRVVWSAAERSVTGKRIRKFDADEIVALAAALEVPVVALFLPPDPNEVPVVVVKPSHAETGVTTEEMLRLATEFDPGTRAQIHHLSELIVSEPKYWDRAQKLLPSIGDLEAAESAISLLTSLVRGRQQRPAAPEPAEPDDEEDPSSEGKAQ